MINLVGEGSRRDRAACQDWGSSDVRDSFDKLVKVLEFGLTRRHKQGGRCHLRWGCAHHVRTCSLSLTRLLCGR